MITGCPGIRASGNIQIGATGEGRRQRPGHLLHPALHRQLHQDRPENRFLRCPATRGTEWSTSLYTRYSGLLLTISKKFGAFLNYTKVATYFCNNFLKMQQQNFYSMKTWSGVLNEPFDRYTMR